MVKRFRQEKAVWLSYGTFLLQQGQSDAASALLQRAIKSLPNKDSKAPVITFRTHTHCLGAPYTPFGSPIPQHILHSTSSSYWTLGWIDINKMAIAPSCGILAVLLTPIFPVLNPLSPFIFQQIYSPSHFSRLTALS